MNNQRERDDNRDAGIGGDNRGVVEQGVGNQDTKGGPRKGDGPREDPDTNKQGGRQAGDQGDGTRRP